MNESAQPGQGPSGEKANMFFEGFQKCYTTHRVAKIKAMEIPNVSEDVAQLKRSNFAAETEQRQSRPGKLKSLVKSTVYLPMMQKS